jgi:hypothetical protein
MTNRAEMRKMGWIDGIGFACVIATLLLSGGVSTVRADSPEGALMSIDPVLVAARADPPAALVPTPVTPPGDQRAGVPAAEIAPGVIRFNTRGYNYGPPTGEISAAAIQHEPRTATAPAAKSPEID